MSTLDGIFHFQARMCVSIRPVMSSKAPRKRKQRCSSASSWDMLHTIHKSIFLTSFLPLHAPRFNRSAQILSGCIRGLHPLLPRTTDSGASRRALSLRPRRNWSGYEDAGGLEQGEQHMQRPVLDGTYFPHLSISGQSIPRAWYGGHIVRYPLGGSDREVLPNP